MSVLDDLRRLSSAEDFFRYLDVAYEPSVVNVAKLKYSAADRPSV